MIDRVASCKDEQEQQRQGVQAGEPEAEPVEGAGRRRRAVFVVVDHGAPRSQQHVAAAAVLIVVVIHGVAAELVRVVGGQPGRGGAQHGPVGVPPVHDVRDAVPGGPAVPAVPQRRAARIQRRRRAAAPAAEAEAVKDRHIYRELGSITQAVVVPRRCRSSSLSFVLKLVYLFARRKELFHRPLLPPCGLHRRSMELDLGNNFMRVCFVFSPMQVSRVPLRIMCSGGTIDI